MDNVNFVPFYDNILIKKETGEVKSESGLYLVNNENTRDYAEGVVVKCGIGYKLQNGELRPLLVKPGDIVIYRKMTECGIKLEGVDFYIISEGNVLGVK